MDLNAASCQSGIANSPGVGNCVFGDSVSDFFEGNRCGVFGTFKRSKTARSAANERVDEPVDRATQAECPGSDQGTICAYSEGG